jgi:hypothetical protein
MARWKHARVLHTVFYVADKTDLFPRVSSHCGLIIITATLFRDREGGWINTDL